MNEPGATNGTEQRPRIRVGAVFPTCEIGTDPHAIRTWAREVEAMGFASIVVFDHVLGAQHADRHPPLWGPYDETHAFHEPMVLLGYLAAVTEHVTLATGVLVLPQRQSALVAKQATEIDLLSGGRLRLGVGTGWNPVEYESLGIPFHGRGARLDEQVDLLRALWSAPVISHDGERERIDRAGIEPRPQRPIPIWFGGFNDLARRRAARSGDGFIVSPTTVDSVRTQLESLRRELEVCGREPGVYPIEVGCMWSDGEQTVGATVELARSLEVSDVSVNTMTTTARWRADRTVKPLGGVGEHLAALAEFVERFGALLNAER